MTLLDPRLWGAFLLAVVLAAGGGYWKGHHDADQSATVAQLKSEKESLGGALELYRKTNLTLNGIAANGRTELDQAQAAARASDATSIRLQQRVTSLAAELRAATAAGRSAPTVGGTDALDLLTGLLSRTDQAAGELAKFADAAHIAGLACERSYDALTVIEKN
ncbi:DUF2514 family protein [Pandoraea terrigena]|uniref:Gp23 n=1 Tax=Pandoraea terrigena TaxID=2508292 RepID=A0A5E4VA98_9BURK|nr:DUF2514 family protein [Pandoraea terrigena]VVE07840.1 gp23 [Pandoraea terrigena]